MNKLKKLYCYRRQIIKKLLQVLGLYVFPIFKYLSKYFAQIYGAQYGVAMLVYLQRLVFTNDGGVVGVIIGSVERYNLAKIKPTESEAKH